MRIRTSYYAKPIPDRRHDWCAWDDDRDENGPRGWGETEQQAIDNLIDLIDEERAIG
jgi:hypothetical protein